jgi:hypothetical protein
MVLVGERAQAFWKRSQPLPPMEQQLSALKDWLNERLNQQDDDSVARLTKLREDIGIENSKIHDRITSHGQSLYHLKGIVDGMRGHHHP